MQVSPGVAAVETPVETSSKRERESTSFFFFGGGSDVEQTEKTMNSERKNLPLSEKLGERKKKRN